MHGWRCWVTAECYSNIFSCKRKSDKYWKWKKKSWVNLNYTSGEEEMHMETDHNLDVNASCQRGTRGRARPPQITKHELTLRLPADKSCSWVGKHLTWTTGPDLPSVRSSPLRSLFLDQPYHCFCLFQNANARETSKTWSWHKMKAQHAQKPH